MDRARKGFTLVELLVVIGIIAVLIAILFPAAGAVRRQGREMTCLSNVRQISSAVVAYTQENEGKTFRITGNVAGKYWHHVLAKYLGSLNYVSSPSGGSVFLCPAAIDPGPTFGSRTQTWSWNGAYGSYGINLWLIPNFPEYPPGPNFPASGFFNSMTYQFDTPVFGDSVWVGSWPDNNDAYHANSPDGWTAHQRGEFMGRFCFDRHRNAINVGFADGSARRTTLGDLWMLRWNRTSVPRSMNIP